MGEADARLSLAVARTWAHLTDRERSALLLLEWVAHGIPWLIGSTLGFLYVSRNGYSIQVQRKWAVLLFGILTDLAAVGLIKMLVRRPRPPYNFDDQIYEAPVADKYSFPSGHTSRAAMLAILLIELLHFEGPISRVSILTFPFLLGLSRVALGRHFLSDIIAGLVLGSVEALLSLELSADLVNALTTKFPIIFQP